MNGAEVPEIAGISGGLEIGAHTVYNFSYGSAFGTGTPMKFEGGKATLHCDGGNAVKRIGRP